MNILGLSRGRFPTFRLQHLRKQAEVVVKQAHRDAAAAVGSREPAYVAHLCRHMPMLGRRWSNTLRKARPGLRLELHSVFTHSVPLVQSRITGDKCELADLLVVVIDRRVTPHRGNATLVQAKLNSTSTLSLSAKESVQLELLQKRPPFDIVKPRVVAHAPFNLGAVDSSATCYGGGFLSAPGSPGWFGSSLSGVASPWLAGLAKSRSSTKPDLVDLPSLLSFGITGLLAGTWGNHFFYDPSGKWWLLKDDWSKLINYLLQEAQTSVHTFRASGGKSDSRWNGTAMHFQASLGKRTLHSFDYVPEDDGRVLPALSKKASEDGGGDDGNFFDIGTIEGDWQAGPPSVVEFAITGEQSGDDWGPDYPSSPSDTLF